MHLIEALAAGIAGGGNGEVDIFLRGTTTRATYYTSFEGDGSTTPVAPIPLGTNGQLVVYVNAICDVVVRDSLDNTIREFTSASSATCIEVISDSFTGTAYSGGGAAVNLPTTLAAILNLVNNSFGSTNWQLTGGTNADAGLTALSGIYYNVKNYGAAGDGVTNDAVAIAAAITAATAAGGGTVFFPPGTYMTSAALTAPSTVPLQGAGASVSKLRLTNAAAFLTLNSSMDSMTLDATVNQTFRYILLDGKLTRCVIGDDTHTAPTLVTGTLAARDCTFIIAGSSQGLQRSGGLDCIGCGVSVVPTTYTGSLVGDGTTGIAGTWIGGYFSLQATTGPGYVFNADADAGQSLQVVGAQFGTSTGALTVFRMNSSTNPVILDVGNAIVAGTGLVPYDFGTATLLNFLGQLQLRKGRSITYSSDAASLTIDTLNYEQVKVIRGTNGTQTVTFADAPPGCRVTVLYHNDHAAGGGTITFDTTRVDMVAASNQFTIAANSYRIWQFESRNVNNNLRWCELEMAAADEPE